MIDTDSIKSLISEGKTLEALDKLQALLMKNDVSRYNQTLLLESQYRELVKKQQLGLEDNSVEINRINLALLGICDEIKQNTPAVPVTNINPTDTSRGISFPVENENGSPLKVLLIIGIFIAVAIGIVFFLIRQDSESDNNNVPDDNLQTNTPSVPNDQPVWSAAPNPFDLNASQFGQMRFTVLEVEKQNFDDEHDRILMNLKVDCLKSGTDHCVLNNTLSFGLVAADSSILALNEKEIFQEPDVRSFSKLPLDFIIPKNSDIGGLRAIFSSGNVKRTALIQLDVNN